MSDKPKLTTNAGCPVADNQNVMTAGPRGPQLLQDVWFLEKLAHFDREVIPERRMHAKGSGAYGTFTGAWRGGAVGRIPAAGSVGQAAQACYPLCFYASTLTATGRSGRAG